MGDVPDLSLLSLTTPETTARERVFDTPETTAREHQTTPETTARERVFDTPDLADYIRREVLNRLFETSSSEVDADLCEKVLMLCKDDDVDCTPEFWQTACFELGIMRRRRETDASRENDDGMETWRATFVRWCTAVTNAKPRDVWDLLRTLVETERALTMAELLVRRNVEKIRRDVAANATYLEFSARPTAAEMRERKLVRKLQAPPATIGRVIFYASTPPSETATLAVFLNAKVFLPGFMLAVAQRAINATNMAEFFHRCKEHAFDVLVEFEGDGNEWGDTVLTHMCKRAFPSLRVLQLSQNQFTAVGFRDLFIAIENGHFPALEDLAISRNKLGRGGLQHLVDICARGALDKLTVLDVIDAGFTDITPLTDLLVRNPAALPSLQEIYLASDVLTPAFKRACTTRGVRVIDYGDY